MSRSSIIIAGFLFLFQFVVSVVILLSQPARQTEALSFNATKVEVVKPALIPTVTVASTSVIQIGPIRNSTPEGALQILYYSYYNPDLLAPVDFVDGICANQEKGMCHTINCWEFNVFEGKCESAMATGLDWHDYVGKAVACGFEYPLGTIFHVLEPEKLAGMYTCLDRCPACTSNNQLDFLSLTQELPWNQKLIVKVTH